MRRWNKVSVKVAAGILTALMITTQAVPVHASAGWNRNSTGWWWEESDGSYPAGEWKQINGVWYYFDGDGYMATGWRYLGGTWYYLDGSGAMVTGWRNIGGTWYYFYGSGAMASDTTIDGYYLNSSGAWVEQATGQWVSSGNRWWYRNADGSYPAGGWKEIGGTWYLFDKDGWMLTGWQTMGGNWYYMDESGAMLTGWQNIGNDWYCLESDGHWNVNAGNNPNAEKPSSGGNTTTGETPEHVHDWQPVFGESIEHPAEGYWEKVLVAPEYYNPITESHQICFHCGYDYTANNDTSYTHVCPDGTSGSGYGNDDVIVGYEKVEAIYEDQFVVTKEAWTETPVIGYTCICGATKDAE